MHIISILSGQDLHASEVPFVSQVKSGISVACTGGNVGTDAGVTPHQISTNTRLVFHNLKLALSKIL